MRKCLLLCAKRYSVCSSLVRGFEANGFRTLIVDYEEFFPDYINSFIRQTESLPNRIKDTWKKEYIKKTNNFYKATFREFCPDVVLIYNNQNIQPWLLDEFKKSAKIVFFLGDHPLYTPTNIYSLQILFGVDYIICPDSFWATQLVTMGVQNVIFDSIAASPTTYYSYPPEIADLSNFGSEIVYVGSSHKNNWGFKRFLFLSQFLRYNLKVYLSGDGYKKRWKPFFPELEKSIIVHNRFDPSFNNKVYNCSKISPVDLVPSLFNGIHIRVWEILGAGIFPLCEYSLDIEKIFEGIPVPFVRNYKEATDIASYMLKHENERLDMIRNMKYVVEGRFTPDKVISRMLNYINRPA